jgi:hypothetical protein
MLFFFVGNGGMKAPRYWQQRNEYSMLLESAPGISIHGSHWLGDGRIFIKISAPFSLINTCQINLRNFSRIHRDGQYIKVDGNPAFREGTQILF